MLPFKKRHWIALRKIDKNFWNLDSKLDAPECIGTECDLLSYLNTQLKSNDKELFIIVSSDAEKQKLWLKNDGEDRTTPDSFQELT